MQSWWADRIRLTRHACFEALWMSLLGTLAAFLILAFICFLAGNGWARDGDDHGNRGPLKAWFDQLASKKGLCCSFADGVKIDDVDWQTAPDGKHYQVRLDKKWVDVPDSAVITEPNRFGPAVVWPWRDSNGEIQIRCFMPGAGT